jgi:DNA-binding protein YbaB
MNMQAMLQQAQKLQKEIMQSKKEIDEKTYISKKGIVEVEMKGTKEIKDLIKLSNTTLMSENKRLSL